MKELRDALEGILNEDGNVICAHLDAKCLTPRIENAFRQTVRKIEEAASLGIVPEYVTDRWLAVFVAALNSEGET